MNAKMRVSEHVDALRICVLKTLLIISLSTAVSLVFYSQIFAIITFPLKPLEKVAKLILLGPAEGLQIIFKTSFLTGLSFSSPFWLYQILKFVLPAVPKEKRNIFFPFILCTILSLVLGSLFALNICIPFANRYLIEINENLGQNYWSLSNYIDYSIMLICSNSLIFELCVILTFLIRYRLVSHQSLKRKRKPVLVAIFIVSALLTPPDVFTQFLMAIPLILIYEAAIFYASRVACRTEVLETPLDLANGDTY